MPPQKRFLDLEKSRQIQWKISQESWLPTTAQKPGEFFSQNRHFCLPEDFAKDNLHPIIQEQVLQYFFRNHIHWNGSFSTEKPSNHLCSSQVMLINLLFPFISDQESVKHIFRAVFPTITQILPLEQKGHFISFEWLPVHLMNKGKLRGIGSPSVDFSFLYRDDKGLHLVLGESKYTESYRNQWGLIHKSPEKSVCSWLNVWRGKPSSILSTPFQESLFNANPFRQLGKSTQLAQEILHRNPELESVKLLWIVPKSNKDLLEWPLLQLGGWDSPFEYWKTLSSEQINLHVAYWEDLKEVISDLALPKHELWKQEIFTRYDW